MVKGGLSRGGGDSPHGRTGEDVRPHLCRSVDHPSCGSFGIFVVDLHVDPKTVGEGCRRRVWVPVPNQCSDRVSTAVHKPTSPTFANSNHGRVPLVNTPTVTGLDDHPAPTTHTGDTRVRTGRPPPRHPAPTNTFPPVLKENARDYGEVQRGGRSPFPPGLSFLLFYCPTTRPFHRPYTSRPHDVAGTFPRSFTVSAPNLDRNKG